MNPYINAPSNCRSEAASFALEMLHLLSGTAVHYVQDLLQESIGV